MALENVLFTVIGDAYVFQFNAMSGGGGKNTTIVFVRFCTNGFHAATHTHTNSHAEDTCITEIMDF